MTFPQIEFRIVAGHCSGDPTFAHEAFHVWQAGIGEAVDHSGALQGVQHNLKMHGATISWPILR